jgi:hypothetical protein
MANATLIYGGLISLIETKLPAYSRLADAYDVEANDALRLQKGYSLGISTGENTFRYIEGSQLASRREFILSFANVLSADSLDASGRASAELSLFEDVFSVWKELQKTTVLGGVQVAECGYISDNGIEYLGDVQKTIVIVSAVSAEYFE